MAINFTVERRVRTPSMEPDTIQAVVFYERPDNPNYPPNTASIPALRIGEKRTGQIKGPAPWATAHASIELKLDFPLSSMPGEWVVIQNQAPNVITHDLGPIASTYRLTIDNIKCLKTRNGGPDHVLATCTALLDGAVVRNPNAKQFDNPKPQTETQDLGHIPGSPAGATLTQATPHMTTLSFDFDSIPSITNQLVFNYTFVHSSAGETDPSKWKDVVNIVVQAAEKVATYFVPSGSAAWTAIGNEIISLFSGLWASCDGLVIADQRYVQMTDLEAKTGPNGPSSPVNEIDKDYPGQPSPVICGDTSHYGLTWTIRRITYGPVAPILVL